MNAHLDFQAAQALMWVASGADNTDYGSVLFVEFDHSRVTIRTNTVCQRTVDLRRQPDSDDGDPCVVAVRAKALSGAASKVEEGDGMGIRVDSDKGLVHVSAGAASMTLQDLREHVIDTDVDRDTKTLAEVGMEILPSLHRAWSVSSQGRVTLSGSKDAAANVLTVGSDQLNPHSEDAVYTQEIFPFSGSDFRVLVENQQFRHVKPLTKIDEFDRLTLLGGRGFLLVELGTLDTEAPLKSVSFIAPTVGTSVTPGETPCDGDIMPMVQISKKVLRSAIKPISGAVSSGATLTLDSSGKQHVVLRVQDNDGNAKVTVLDALVINGQVVSMPLELLSSGLKSIEGDEVSIGTVDYEDETWVSLSPVFDESAESSGHSDIVVAIAPRPDEEG